jgi:hypothetical protein
MRLAILAGLAAVALSAPAFAQNVVQGEDKTVFKKKTMIDFSDVTLEGELKKPEGQYGLVRGRTDFDSLIKRRMHFTQELEKSTDQL